MLEVYILYSESLAKYYVGFSNSASSRLRQHRKEKNHWTARADDWELIWKQAVDSTAAARVLEKKIKSRGAKRFLEDHAK
ncbi:MAG: GIY-YIG nuclease family protein [Kiritimatiellales bacterium]|nr:GIY-YIG nuclease family protein [Kiritimatiellales bacterium]